MARLAGAGDRLVLDEGYTWLVGEAPTAGVFLDRLAAFENTPPLYYVLLTPLKLTDELWVRWPSLVAGVATVLLAYLITASLATRRAGLLAALIVAVAPYQVATGNLARGFMLATAGLLLAVWAAARLSAGSRRRWWWVYALGVVIAVWAEYYAVLTIVALLIAMVALRVRPHREVLLFGLLPLLTMVPWMGELRRSLELNGTTKVLPEGPRLSAGLVRDELVPLFLGEQGESPALRSMALIALALAVATFVWRSRHDRELLALVGGTAAGALMLHATASSIGPGVFESRYLSVIAPLVAVLVAPGLTSLPRPLTTAAFAVLVAVGIGVTIERHGRELEPEYGQVAAYVRSRGVRLALTNSPVVRYYLRQELRVVVDRPFGLGPGREAQAFPPYAVIDDAEVGTGPRSGPGRTRGFGRIEVRVLAAPANIEAGDGRSRGPRYRAGQ